MSDHTPYEDHDGTAVPGSDRDVTDGRGPWWASGADALDDGVDPFTAYSEARSRAGRERPWDPPQDADPPPPPGTARSTFDDAVEGLAALARLAAARGERGRGGERGHDPATCRACPWCTFLRAVGDSRPEVVAHLTEAMRHVTLAARAMVDAADGRGGWEHIPLDDLDDLDDQDDDGGTR